MFVGIARKPSGRSALSIEAPFRHGYLLHRSKRNRAESSRRALVNHYMSAQSLLPWGTTTEPSTGLEDNRQVVQVVGADPYIWKSTPLSDPSQVFLRDESALLGLNQG